MQGTRGKKTTAGVARDLASGRVAVLHHFGTEGGRPDHKRPVKGVPLRLPTVSSDASGRGPRPRGVPYSWVSGRVRVEDTVLCRTTETGRSAVFRRDLPLTPPPSPLLLLGPPWWSSSGGCHCHPDPEQGPAPSGGLGRALQFARRAQDLRWCTGRRNPGPSKVPTPPVPVS